MSGIAALLYRDGRPAQQSDLKRMANALRAYGPERQTVTTVDRVGFAYAHYTSTPEGRGLRQPVFSSDDRFSMVFDG
ncbi:MAG: hypothetical protein AAF692_10385, partial [Pseudomonadota bacterium]